MNFTRSITTGLLLCALCLAPATAFAKEKAAATQAAKEKTKDKSQAKAKAAPKEKHVGLSSYYSGLAQSAGLDDKQRAALAEAQNEQKKAMAAMQKEWRETRTAYLEAKKSGDEGQIAKTKVAYDAALEQRKATDNKFNDTVRSILKPDQVDKWVQARLVFGAKSGYGKANLTADQEAKIESLAADASKKIAKIDPKDDKAIAVVERDFKMSIRNDVLTDAQRDGMGMKGKPAAKEKAKAKAKAKPATKKPKKEKAEKDDDAGDDDGAALDM